MGKPGGSLSELEWGWRHVYARHERMSSLEAELKAAEAAMGENMTDETFARFNSLRQQVEKIAGEDVEFESTIP